MTTLTSLEQGTLHASPPFSMRHATWFVDQFLTWRGDQVVTPTTIIKATSINGQVVLFKVSAGQEPAAVDFELASDRVLDGDLQQQLRQRITDYLGLNDDLSTFYERARGDHPAFGAIVERFYGFHQVRFLTLVENAAWQVMAAGFRQILAVGMKDRLVEAVGGRIERDGVVYRSFPEMETLLALSEAEINSIIRNTRRAHLLVRMLADLPSLDVELLAHGPYDQAAKALRKVSGIGAWSASGILMRHFGRMDSIPLSMDAFAEPAAAVYGPSVDMNEIVHRYGDQIGYWSWYLKNGIVPGTGEQP